MNFLFFPKSARFPWKIFYRFVFFQGVLIILTLSLSALGARYYFKQYFLLQNVNSLKDIAATLSGELSRDGHPDTWCAGHAAGRDYRLTWIDTEGKVICDSLTAVSDSDMRSGRPEIETALRDGWGSSTRWSNALSDEILYVAVRLSGGGGVVRISNSLKGLNSALAVFDASLLAFLGVVAAILVAFAAWTGRSLAVPIGRILDKAHGVLGLQEFASDSEEEDFYGELSDLETSLDHIRRDLKAKTESLSLEREELSTLMSAISDAILAVDTDGVPLFFNSRFALLFGEEQPEKLRALKLWQVFRAPDVLDTFEAALKEGKASSMKAIPFGQETANKRFFSLSASPLRKKDGAIYGAVGIFHDVTDLKSAEQIRIDFVANVSHELRTPLTSIKGYTDTLIDDLKTGRPVMPEFLDIISRNSSRLMSLIGDLLDLSSLESTDVLQKQDTDIEEITSRVLKQLSGHFEAKNQKVDLAIGTPIVCVDPKRLEQVLVNLLDNACKYTPAGGKIRIAWESEGDQKDVLLKVVDNGPGIPPEHMPRLFERFYRVDKARSREQGGTGLGLAIVKHIMQRHNGDVWVESRPGEGTQFICRFPHIG